MAIGLVQSATGTASNSPSSTLAYGSDVTAGNLLVVSGGLWTGGTTQTQAITDTLGTSYTVLMGPEGLERTWIAYGIAPSSGPCTVTINPTPDGAYQAYVIAEWSGIAATPLDVNGGTSTGTGTTASDGITTVAAETLVLATMSQFSTADIALTPDTAGGWTQLAEYELSGSIANYNCQYQIFSSAGAKTASWTIGSSQDWGAQTVSFIAAVTAAPFTLRESTLRGGDVLRGVEASGPQTIAIFGIPSLEVAGIELITQTAAPATMPMAEAPGAVRTAPVIKPVSVGTVEQLGVDRGFVRLSPLGLFSSERHGAASLRQRTSPSAVTGDEAHGRPSIFLRPALSGIQTSERHGRSAAWLRTAPGGIDTAEAHGRISAAAVIALALAGIPSIAAMGTVAAKLAAQLIAIQSDGRLGLLRAGLRLSPQPIGTAEQLTAVRIFQRLSWPGLPSAESRGPVRIRLFVLLPGVGTLEAHGILLSDLVPPIVILVPSIVLSARARQFAVEAESRVFARSAYSRTFTVDA